MGAADIVARVQRAGRVCVQPPVRDRARQHLRLGGDRAGVEKRFGAQGRVRDAPVVELDHAGVAPGRSTAQREDRIRGHERVRPAAVRQRTEGLAVDVKAPHALLRGAGLAVIGERDMPPDIGRGRVVLHGKGFVADLAVDVQDPVRAAVAQREDPAARAAHMVADQIVPAGAGRVCRAEDPPLDRKAVGDVDACAHRAVRERSVTRIEPDRILVGRTGQITVGRVGVGRQRGPPVRGGPRRKRPGGQQIVRRLQQAARVQGAAVGLIIQFPQGHGLGVSVDHKRAENKEPFFHGVFLFSV